MRLASASVALVVTTISLGFSGAAQAAWLAPQDVNVGSLSRASGAAIAPDGTVTSVFTDGQANQRALKVAVKPAGQPFRAPVQLSSVQGRVGFAFTASDRQGNVAVVWDEDLNGTSVVRGATKPAGGEFTAAQSISDTGSGARWPRVAMGGGQAVVAWAQGGRVRAASATAGSPFTVHDPISSPVGFDDPPAVAVAPSGAAVIAWATPGLDGTAELHAAARTTGTGAFAALPDIVSVPAMNIHNLQLAMSASGRATVAWKWFGSAHAYLQIATRGASGKFGGVETLPAPPGDVTLAVADDDTALLAWAAQGALRYALRPSGSGLEPARSVPGAQAHSAAPDVVFSSDGSARLLWVGGPGPRASVQTARVAPDGTSGPPETVSPPSEAPAGANDDISAVLDLATDDHGNAVAVWSHGYDAAAGPAFDMRYRIRTAMLDETPPTISAMRVPASAFTGKTAAMSIATADTLSGATAIWDFGDGTSEEGETLAKSFPTGTYTVRVTVTDGAGNATTATAPIRVAPASKGG